MKKTFIIFLTVIAVSLFSCRQASQDDLSPVTNDVSEITVSESVIYLLLGQGVTLSATVSPWNANDKNVVWSSSNPEVATVSNSGPVLAISEGETDIIASAGGKSGSCHVTVSKLNIPVEEIEVSIPSRSLAIGETLSPSIILSPANTTDQAEWSSSNRTIADVVDNKIVGVGEGYVDISMNIGDLSWSETILVHQPGLWMEQVDPLLKPVKKSEFEWNRDTICVARGETATVQMLVKAFVAQGKDFVPEVVYFDHDGQTNGLLLTPKVNHVREVRASDHWDYWCGGAAPDRFDFTVYDIPDALLPQSDYQRWLRAGEHCGVWADFDIPRDFQPGLYNGLFKITGDNEATLPFWIKVYDVTLPEKQGLDILQWPNMEVEAMAGGNSVDMYSVLSDYMPKIVQLASEYGQNGWRFLYADGSYKMLSRNVVKNEETGKWDLEVVFNQSYYEREFELFYNNTRDLRYIQGHNIVAARGDGEITVLGYRLDEHGDLWTDGEGNAETQWVTLPGDDIAPAKYYFRKYFDGLRKMLTSNFLPDGRPWMDVYMQTLSDEPDDAMSDAYNMLAGIINEVAPDFTLCDPIQSDLINTANLDIPCPDELKAGTLPRQTGQKYWMYTCMGPQGNYANRFIRIPLLKTRIIHWLNYHYNCEGYLHWGLNYWVGAKEHDPWKDAYGDFIAGDMWIIWPGDNKVYPSIRLSAMRDGIRDYDLLKMVEQKSKADADAFCNRLIINAEAPTYDMDVSDFRQLRKDILEYLSK